MQPRHYSQLYRSLRAIAPDDYHRIIRTYEEKEQEIGRLEVDEHFELTVSYVDALFETGAYRRHQLMVDLVIHACIHHDFRRAEGIERDVFEHMLFRKAASAYRLRDFATAEHVGRELLRINPADERHERFLRTTFFQRQQPTLQFGRGAFIFCLLLAAFLITLNLLVVRSFYPDQVRFVQIVTADTLLLGLLALAGTYGYVFLGAHRAARDFRRAAENKRRPDSL